MNQSQHFANIAASKPSLVLVEGHLIPSTKAVCITAEPLLTAGLPAGVVVAQTGKDQVKILARKIGKRHIAEKILPISFKEMLFKDIIVAVKEIPPNLKRFYEVEVPVTALEPVKVEELETVA